MSLTKRWMDERYPNGLDQEQDGPLDEPGAWEHAEESDSCLTDEALDAMVADGPSLDGPGMSDLDHERWKLANTEVIEGPLYPDDGLPW